MVELVLERLSQSWASDSHENSTTICPGLVTDREWEFTEDDYGISVTRNVMCKLQHGQSPSFNLQETKRHTCDDTQGCDMTTSA